MERSVASDGRPWHHIRLARYYAQAGQLESAISVLQQALGQWPEAASVRLELLRQLTARGDYTDMLSRAQEGTRLHPENHVFHYYEGETLMMHRRWDEARSAYEQALAHDAPEAVRQRIEMQLQTIQGLRSPQP